MRLVQHKKEAYWFYRFLSIFYDKLVNPLFWTTKMRDDAHELARFHARDLKTIDVGSGTGFNTEGLVRHVDAQHITCLDQSPHQMAKAKQKELLQGCTFLLGDAENLPFADSHFDRYVSAGSIEYWPNPQQGINESYRVIKPGGTALMIGPLEPQNGFSRFFSTLWMLFPPQADYLKWYENAGFQDIEFIHVAPHWVGREKYGIAIAGKKPLAENIPSSNTSQNEEKSPGFFRSIVMVLRVLVGSLAGFIFIPMALIGYLFKIGSQRDLPEEYRSRLNIYQLITLAAIFVLIGYCIYLIVS